MTPSAEELVYHKTDDFFSHWKPPELYESFFDKYEISKIWNDYTDNGFRSQGKDYAGRTLNWNSSFYKKYKPFLWKGLKKLYPKLKYEQLWGELLYNDAPTAPHIDGQMRHDNYPVRQFLVPINVNCENTFYKWAGTVIFKQHVVTDWENGAEWHIIGSREKFSLLPKFVDKWKFKKFFGKGYSNMEWRDCYGVPLKHHNDLTCFPKDFGDDFCHIVIRDKNWLKGLDIEQYFNYHPGDLLSFSPYCVLSGANYWKDGVKGKTFFRMRIYENYRI